MEQIKNDRFCIRSDQFSCYQFLVKVIFQKRVAVSLGFQTRMTMTKLGALLKQKHTHTCARAIEQRLFWPLNRSRCHRRCGLLT